MGGSSERVLGPVASEPCWRPYTGIRQGKGVASIASCGLSPRGLDLARASAVAIIRAGCAPRGLSISAALWHCGPSWELRPAWRVTLCFPTFENGAHNGQIRPFANSIPQCGICGIGRAWPRARVLFPRSGAALAPRCGVRCARAGELRDEVTIQIDDLVDIRGGLARAGVKRCKTEGGSQAQARLRTYSGSARRRAHKRAAAGPGV